MDASRSRTRDPLGIVRASVVVVLLSAAALSVALAVAQEPAQAAFPGKNGRIAVVRGDADYTAQIFTVSPSSGNLKQITFGKYSKGAPAWSADGRKIAFVENRGALRYGDIYTMKADGSDQAAVTRNRKDDYDPSWSPDGQRLVFSRQVTEAQPETGEVGNRDLFSVRKDGTDLVRLTRTPEVSELDPAWSPDGKKIAFSTLTGHYYDVLGRIYVMKADSSEPPAVLPPILGAVGGLGWSPDGQWLVFSSGYPRSSCITKIRADGSEEPTSLHFCGVPYAQTEPYPSGPEMSPDGKKIVFNDPYLGLYTLDADGENLKSIGVGGWAPSWQPVVR